MADRDSAVGFESLKSRFLDGRISREAFLEAATALGRGRDAYAWLNTPDTGLAAGVPLSARWYCKRSRLRDDPPTEVS